MNAKKKPKGAPKFGLDYCEDGPFMSEDSKFDEWVRAEDYTVLIELLREIRDPFFYEFHGVHDRIIDTMDAVLGGEKCTHQEAVLQGAINLGGVCRQCGWVLPKKR